MDGDVLFEVAPYDPYKIPETIVAVEKFNGCIFIATTQRVVYYRVEAFNA